MVSQILVIGANSYKFQDEKDPNKEIEGTSVHYVILGNKGEGDSKGYTPVKNSLKPDKAKNIKEVPGIYNGAFKVETGKAGTILKLTDVELIAPVDFEGSPAK